MTLGSHLSHLPGDLAAAIESTYNNVIDHYLKEEWDDAQVDAGHFAEAVLRVLQWHMKGSFTPIDGKSKPNRKNVVNDAERDTTLAPSLRAQLPQAVELMMDFRNNRNAAHLGNIDANRLDATCVVSLVTWSLAEIIRLETQQPADEVQALIDTLAQPYVPLIEKVDGQPVVLDPNMSAADKALVILYDHREPLDSTTLRKWAEYGNTSRWRTAIIADLQRKKLVHVSGDTVRLLRPGVNRAQQVLRDAASK